MLNIYYTSEPTYKVKAFIQNQANFFILDVHKIIRDLGFKLPLKSKGESFFVNQQILDIIKSKLNYKKLFGIIYVNKKLNKDVVNNLKLQTGEFGNLGKHVLLDNALIPKHNCIYGCFDEVVFYENFKKAKIFEINDIKELTPMDASILNQ